MVCPPVREIIHELKLVDYLLVQADKAWYDYYVSRTKESHFCPLVYDTTWRKYILESLRNRGAYTSGHFVCNV